MRTVLFRMLLASAVLVVMAPAAMAQDEFDCDDFSTQEGAQDQLDATPGDPHDLDEDDDGIACEELPSAGDDGASDDGGAGEDADRGQVPAGGAGEDADRGQRGQLPAGGVATGGGGTAASGLPLLQLLVGTGGALTAAGLTAMTIRTLRR